MVCRNTPSSPPTSWHLLAYQKSLIVSDSKKHKDIWFVDWSKANEDSPQQPIQLPSNRHFRQHWFQLTIYIYIEGVFPMKTLTSAQQHPSIPPSPLAHCPTHRKGISAQNPSAFMRSNIQHKERRMQSDQKYFNKTLSKLKFTSFAINEGGWGGLPSKLAEKII